MRIFQIDYYRDGGSISFRVERDHEAYLVWLDTPLGEEARALKIISVPTGRTEACNDEFAAKERMAELSQVRRSAPLQRGDPVVKRLLADIAEWWATVPREMQERVRYNMARPDGFYDIEPSEEAVERDASNLERVMTVRDYVMRRYAE